MNDTDVLAAAFEEHRAHLRGVAYRLLGSMPDADDAVQEAWLRLTSTDPGEVENLGGWLTTVVARVALNTLRTRRRRPEEPIGADWPEPMDAAVPEEEAVLADSVGLALIVVLDTLTPAERLAFVLHDLFAMPFTEVGAALGRSPEAARQLASRGRRRVRGAPRPDRAADLARQREVATAFLAASRGGDLSALVAVLDEDVTLTADAFAAPGGKPERRQGAQRVARGALAASTRAGYSQLALVDGEVGIVFAPGGQLRVVLKLTVSRERKITVMDIIADPDRLRRLRLAVLPE
ncbi:MAG TPA: sigma-70 family RNA polymerase sigma factor [Streptosporangiaceae bacterium]|jgi:RNA polymerase sigma-70 factor (ECF subfamily)|nr:sigma-70 family RNA polymerase sigma factor [Streptosporangiaceae bacterium]